MIHTGILLSCAPETSTITVFVFPLPVAPVTRTCSVISSSKMRRGWLEPSIVPSSMHLAEARFPVFTLKGRMASAIPLLLSTLIPGWS